MNVIGETLLVAPTKPATAPAADQPHPLLTATHFDVDGVDLVDADGWIRLDDVVTRVTQFSSRDPLPALVERLWDHDFVHCR